MSVGSRALAATFAASAVLVGLLAATPASASTPALPAADPPPSIAQLCAATGDQTIDTLLAGVSETDLVDALAPLLTLTVPQNQGRVLNTDVDVDDVREALNCSNDTPATSTTDAPPTTTPPATAPTEQPDPDVVAARIAAQIDILSCDDYRDELAAIRGALLDTDTQTLLGSQRVGELLERLRLRNAAINSCVSPASVPTSSVVVNGDVTVNPLDDDDSLARVDGGQIRIVPQGSASTGGA